MASQAVTTVINCIRLPSVLQHPTNVSIAVVGIDLGTTYSVVAIAQKNQVTVIPDVYGHVIIPSMVAFVAETKQPLVGRPARAHRTKDPTHTIFNAKRFIGKRSTGSIALVRGSIDANVRSCYQL